MTASDTSATVRTRGGGAGSSSRRALSRQIASTMPVSAERISARASILGSNAHTTPGMLSARRASRAGVDERGRPAHRIRAVRLARAAAAALALPEQRNHRAVRRELHRPDRDPAEPADARPDVVADLIGAGRDQPAEHVADRDRERVGARAARAPTPASCRAQPDAGALAAVSIAAEPFAVDAALAAARRPRHDPAGNPRHLQLDRRRRARLLVAFGLPVVRGASRPVGSPRWSAGSVPRLRSGPLVRVPGPGRGDAALLRLEVGDHLLALVAAQRSGRSRGAPRRRARKVGERGAPRHPVGLEHRELFGRGLAVDLGLHVLLELPVGELQRRRRAHAPRRSARRCTSLRRPRAPGAAVTYVSAHTSPLDNSEDTASSKKCGGQGPLFWVSSPRSRAVNRTPGPFRLARSRERNGSSSISVEDRRRRGGSRLANAVDHATAGPEGLERTGRPCGPAGRSSSAMK